MYSANRWDYIVCVPVCVILLCEHYFGSENVLSISCCLFACIWHWIPRGVVAKGWSCRKKVVFSSLDFRWVITKQRITWWATWITWGRLKLRVTWQQGLEVIKGQGLLLVKLSLLGPWKGLLEWSVPQREGFACTMFILFAGICKTLMFSTQVKRVHV